MTMRATESDITRLFLNAHRHVWREHAPPPDLGRHDLQALLPALLSAGSAGLIWPALSTQADRYGAAGFILQQAYDRQVEHNRLVEERIGQAVERLGCRGIPPVIIKGWSLSRRYPKGIVRSAGDIDLVVPAADYDRALGTLVAWAESTGEISIELHHGDRPVRLNLPGRERVRRVDIDLHRDTCWDSMPAPDALRHAQHVPIGGCREVGVLCPEDNLRQLSLHFLWHGATRLLRLVDIALVLESRPAGFDWGRCLGTDPIRRTWVVAALGLAHHLLGARIDDTPVADEARSLPGWLLPVAERQVQMNQAPLGVAWREFRNNPRDIAGILRRRWPDPITGTTHLPAAFTATPRLPIQCAVFLRTMGGYTVRRLHGQIEMSGYPA